MPKSSAASSSHDLGLLFLRLVCATSLFIKHGMEKLFTFSAMAAHFPDPIHIGHIPTLIIATIADGICMPLLVLGLFTRWAALWSLCNLFVAWAFVHHFQFAGRGGDHGELIVVYMGVMLALVIAGPGRFSIDARLGR
ncbi:MAG TPA: DoxX family protein [Acidobacteriaceae bacterium]|jgi:putative oxidoreductase|nr:DoxX family protein [Acidobacteriaceae bacterium]